VIVVDRRTATDDPDGRLQLNVRIRAGQLLADHYRQMDDAVLRPYLRQTQGFVRTGTPTRAADARCR
jgi:hypothetical protein